VKKNFLSVLLLIISFCLNAQDQGVLYGIVLDNEGEPVENVNVFVERLPQYGAITGKKGKYEISLPANKSLIVGYTHVSLESDFRNIVLKSGQRLEINVRLRDKMMEQIDIVDERNRKTTQVRLSTKNVSQLPSSSLTGISAKIIAQAGVSSSSELSSQYSVRGGNFDENLVVVNQTSIQRPFLVRSGQQEGLSFVNPDLVSSVEFSSGGFEAKYDDKISSVLDINYKRPRKSEGAISASMMGGSLYWGGADKSQRFSHCTGVRYKNPSLILESLNGESIYRPSFLDGQTYMTYQISPRLSVDALLYAAQNSYYFEPIENKQTIGGGANTIGIETGFEGSEEDRFSNYLASGSAKYKVTSNLHIGLSLDYFYSQETESYDIITDYRLGDAIGEDVVNSFALGRFQEHARNRFGAGVFSGSIFGKYFVENHKTEWGIKLKSEKVKFNIQEWTMIDSADYSIPHSEERLELFHFANGELVHNNEEFSAFVQHSITKELKGGQELSLTAGLRGSYKNLNNQFLFSPRLRLSFSPKWEKDVVFRFATGLYQQHPSLREFIRPDGTFASDVKAQKTMHYVLGADYNLKIWERPFKLVAEIYYKDLLSVIPYVVDNVMIQYFPDQTAEGYTSGLDLKLNGEFIPGTESWVSLSLMQSEEKIDGDPSGYQRRPSDQMVNIGVFFQDYLPSMETVRMNLALFYGSNLPVWFPADKKEGAPISKIRSYQRADVGLLKEFKIKSKFVDQFWVGLEIFNVLDSKNVISYNWIKDVEGGSYGVPNHLTNRTFNIKVEAKF